MGNTDLQKNILTTIAYYDVMDYPMTAFELHKYLTKISGDGAEYSLLGIINELESDSLRRIVEEYNGFYFLKNKKELVNQRLEKNKIANNKIKILLKTAKWLRFVPFVRMIAITGSLAMKNTDNDSDLDILIVLKQGKIFTGRILVTLVAHLLGKRRYADKIKDRICLNHFLSDKSFTTSLQDMFSASEYSFILPIFGWHNFQEFQKNNDWLKKYKPNFGLDEIPNLKFIKETAFSQRVRQLGEMILKFDFIENTLKKWQLKRIMKDPRTHQDGSMVSATDEALIFLPKPQGPVIFEKFKEHLGKISR